MKKIYRILFAAVFALSATGASAQITQIGTDPGRLRWFSLDTPSYQVIYPAGLDSLARAYALKLEQFRPAEARSIGMLPGGFQRSRTPVILHPYNPYSNGMMLWTPRRMDLYTTPPAYEPDPGPWDTQLAVHESRHLAQMQFGYRGPLFKVLTVLMGEIWPGAAVGIYPNMALLEGDAVVAETALTPAGRTRTAEFLNYFQVAFDHGDFRNWYRWRYGSFKKYSPDHYALGYMTVAGMRYFYADTLFTKRYFDSVVSRPLRFGHFPRTVRAASGKPLQATWGEISRGFRDIWNEEALAREPFMPMEQLTRIPRFATDYANLTTYGGRLYATREALNRPLELVRIDLDGKEKTLRPFAGVTGNLVLDENRHRLYWTETVRNPRWELAGTSRVRYFEGTNPRPRTLTRRGRLYNPQPSPDGSRLAVVDYPWQGGSALVVLSADEGRELRRFPAPDGLQLTEPAWVEETIYVTGVSDKGNGIYRLDGEGVFTPVAGPSIQQLSNFEADGPVLQFVSDRTGVGEWYHLDTGNGELRQMTATRYGLTDPVVEGDTLYFASMTPEGKAVFRTPLSGLNPQRVVFDEVHRYRIEDELAAQEEALAGGPVPAAPDSSILGAPKRYRKLPHLLHIHSWAPLYIDYDELDGLSFDAADSPVGLGATLFFQNSLGSAYGSAGYFAHLPREMEDGTREGWRHSGHLRFTYAGWYPVLEFGLDVNDRAARQYARVNEIYPERVRTGNSSTSLGKPLVSGRLKVYVPLSFSSGGWQRGVIPQLSAALSNDRFLNEVVVARYKDKDDTDPEISWPANIRNVPLSALSGSVRGYVMRPTAPSQTYPSLGVGAEAGWSGRPLLTGLFAPVAYGFLYAYLPGFLPEQGLRVSATYQQSLSPGAPVQESRIGVLPRGFETLSGNVLMRKGSWQCRLTGDFAVPFTLGDVSFLSPALYISHFVFKPHCDVTFFHAGNLLSAGASLTAGIQNLLWAPFAGSIGVSVSYNGGSAYKAFKAEGVAIDGPVHVGLVFTMDI